jgi:uncharacterized repeat protein (TIGR01451 family)
MDKTSDLDTVEVGETLTYTLTATNLGPDEATGVTIIDALPASVTFQSASPSQGSCQHAGGVVTCLMGTLAANASAQVDIQVVPNASGVVANTGVVDGDEGDPDDTNNQDTDETDVTPSGDQADIRVSKLGSPNPVQVGEPLTYTILVNNDGPATATNVTVVDVLPVRLQFQSAATDTGSCSETLGTVTCLLGDMAAATQATVTIVTVGTQPGTVANTAVVDHDGDDPDPNDDRSTQLTLVVDSVPPTPPTGTGGLSSIPTLSQTVGLLLSLLLLMSGLLALSGTSGKRRIRKP